MSSCIFYKFYTYKVGTNISCRVLINIINVMCNDLDQIEVKYRLDNNKLTVTNRQKLRIILNNFEEIELYTCRNLFPTLTIFKAKK